MDGLDETFLPSDIGPWEDAVTLEKNLPKGKPGRMPQGGVHLHVVRGFGAESGGELRPDRQEVLRSYATKWMATTMPLFEGDLDRVAFWGVVRDRVAQWTRALDGVEFSIPAGSLHGLAEGAVLAVMAKATDADDAALGFVKLTSVDRFSAMGGL